KCAGAATELGRVEARHTLFSQAIEEGTIMQAQSGAGPACAGRVARLAVLLATAFLTLAPLNASAAERVMLVLDASGSMAGRIDGVTKLDTAREALASVLKTLPAGTELGLMAYGHRRKGDCGDIETLAE